jgi:serine/threonine protein kinase
VLYELLTGRPPLEAESLAALAEKQQRPAITPVRELAPEVPVDLEAVVMRCLARKTAYRPASAGELERELSPAAAEPLTERLPRRRVPNRRRALWLCLAGLVVLAGILLAVALTESGKRKTPTPPRAVPAIPRGADPQEQAHNIAAWVRRYAGR